MVKTQDYGVYHEIAKKSKQYDASNCSKRKVKILNKRDYWLKPNTEKRKREEVRADILSILRVNLDLLCKKVQKGRKLPSHTYSQYSIFNIQI